VVDAQANIRVNLDSGQALAELKALEKQIQFFNKSIIQGSSEAARIQNEFSSSLIHNINATGKFTASMGKVHTETERFTNALEKNKLSAREYFRYSMASTKSFGKLFGKEFGTITKVAEERVKLLQTRHIELGRAADGAMRAVKIVPNSLDYSKPITQMQLAIQKQQIFNKLLDAGTTKLLNFGKNTQWAGRQLMVGFTIPLTILGGTAIRTFKEMETQAIRFKKVYGDMFTATSETDAALANIKQLANEFTKYGVSVADTIKLAADAAAAGNSGAQLEGVVTQATKLAVLGGVAQDQALEATISIQNAFKVTGEELNNTINFLNAVENQTVVALDDITQAIPKVAPVIRQLGGDIEDLAFFMAAMQEGGVGAAEAANALKSGLASLINPTKAATKMSAELGINLNGIVDANAGDLRMTVMSFAKALEPLDDLARARLIETIFGKYQFARISTLFDNVSKSGTQASRVLQIAAASTEELAIMAERELGITADSAAIKFTASIEKLKASLVPVGAAFAEALTPIIDFATRALEKFNSFSDGTKKAIVTVLAVVGGIGPVLLMSIGLIANGIANIGKFINILRKGYQSLTVGGQALGLSTQYLSTEQLEAVSVANNLHNVHELLTDQFALEANALASLTTVYRQANVAASAFAKNNPQFLAQGAASKLKTPKFGKRMAKGGWVPGSGNKDTVPATLMPGEFVVNKKAAQSNSQTLESMNKGGQAYRSKGTPAFGNFVGRNDGTKPRQTDSISLEGHLQTSGLHLRQGTTKDNGAYRYAGYTMLGNQSFNQLTQNRAADIRPIMGGTDVEGYPMFRKEAKDIASLIESKKDLTRNEKVALKVLQAELKQFPSDKSWQNEMSRRYTLNAVAAEGLDPTSPQGKALMKELDNSFKKASSSSRNSNQLTQRLYANADDLWSKGVLGDKGMGVKAKMLPHKTYRGMPIVKLLSMINDPNLVRAQGKYGLTVPKHLNPKYDSAGNLVSVLDMPMKKQTAGVKTTSPSLGARARSASQRPSGKFGALAALGTVALGATAAQAAQRQTGTPSYGEQGVTPAMLTPGEFVVNSKSAQKFGPQLQAMNKGGVAYRANPSGPGYDITPANEEAWVKSYADAKLWGATDDEATKTANRLAGIKEKSVRGAKVKQSLNSATKAITRTSANVVSKGFMKLTEELKKNGKNLQNNTDLLDDTNKQSGKIAARQKISGAANKAGMLGFGISGAAMAVGMTSQDPKTQESANNVASTAGTIGSLAMALPMLMNPTGALVLTIGAVVGTFLYVNKKLNDAAKEGRKMADSITATAEDISQMEKLTGKVSGTALMDRMRSKRTAALNPLTSDFGDTFIESDMGKKMIEDVNKAGEDAGPAIANKLSSYIMQGLIDAADAQSISEAIGRSINDRNITLKINAQLDKIIGVNGVDLIKNPVEVRVRLLEDTAQRGASVLKTLKEQEDAAYRGPARRGAGSKIGGTEASVVSSIAAGAGVGAGVGTLIGGPIGTVAGAIVGAGVAWKAYGEQQLKAAALTKKFAAVSVGLGVSLLSQSQQLIDSYDAQYLSEKQSLDLSEEENLAQKEILKDAKNQERIEKNLLNIAERRKTIEEGYSAGRKVLVDQQGQAIKGILDNYDSLDPTLKKTMAAESATVVKDKYKGTAGAITAGALTSLTGELKSEKLELLINTNVASDTLGVESAFDIVSLFKEDEAALEKTITLYAQNGRGMESLDRTLTALGGLSDPKLADYKIGLIDSLGKLPTEKYESASKFLDTVASLGNNFDGSTILPQLSTEDMAEAGKDLEKLEPFVEKLSKIKDKDAKKQFVLDFAAGDKDFAALKDDVDWFLSLDPSSQVVYTTVLRSFIEGITPEAIQEKLALMKKNAGGMGQFITEDMATQVLVDEASAKAKPYVQPPPATNIPALGDDPNGGGGAAGSTKVLTAQLIELRMKGLDPAALSTLDKAQADKILSGTAKQQRVAIAALNAELRDQTIQLEVLKTDQEVLQDTMGATTDAVSAYIDMLQATKIDPIQKQIDKYNELSNSQQKQMDLYSRGLQQLSDKEDNINKLYDDRISSIDKVTQANDRSFQRQQNQIDLASAIASGDFGAAAGAAANISNTEAQAQLEDARTALEQQRQAELKALTIEVNGQLFTREQVETNIKNLEESIYQTSLLVRQEQEKIAEIEKTITAEKEKQRKLQVLTQMSQLSTQIQNTANPSARQAMGAQLGYLGESIGLDPNSPESVAATSQSLGINVQALADSILRSQQVANQTAVEFAAEAEKAKKNAGDLSRFYGEASIEGKNSLGYLTSLNTAWAGDSKKSGLGGMVSTGRDILSSLSQSADAIRIGKNQIQNSVDSALAAIRAARKPYAMGGSVTKMAMGGNVSYKGSTEPAPVRMSVGNLVPGLGNTDRVPALLTPGEFVVRKSVAKENLGLLKTLNGDVFPQMSAGIGANATMVPITNTNMEGSTTLYNNTYSVNVNVSGTNSTADEVANVVIRKIKGMNDRGIRGNRY
jgi:TP901 family phage tail tape measure protein